MVSGFSSSTAMMDVQLCCGFLNSGAQVLSSKSAQARMQVEIRVMLNTCQPLQRSGLPLSKFARKHPHVAAWINAMLAASFVKTKATNKIPQKSQKHMAACRSNLSEVLHRGGQCKVKWPAQRWHCLYLLLTLTPRIS